MTLKELISADISDVFLNTSEFADTCLYEGREITLMKFEFGQRRPGSRDLLVESDVTARGVDFYAAWADIIENDPNATPQAGEEIIWTGDENNSETFVVFPRVAGRCFDYADGRDGMAKIYTVAESDLVPLVLHQASGVADITTLAVPGYIRGAEDYTDLRSEVRVLTTTAYVARSDMGDVSTPPPAATCDFLGLDGWSIDMNRTEWGRGLVKIGLMRETLVREWQARRNATV